MQGTSTRASEKGVKEDASKVSVALPSPPLEEAVEVGLGVGPVQDNKRSLTPSNNRKRRESWLESRLSCLPGAFASNGA